MKRVAVVTGSNRGIGRGIATALRRAGYAVVTNGRSSRGGPGHLHVRADVAAPEGARTLIAAARQRFGRVDVLVNNVGDFRMTPVSKMDLADWEDLFTSNVRTAWNCCRAALPLLRRRGGCIVNFGGPGLQAVRGNPRAVAYQMAKTALAVFTKSLARAEAARGVRVNMVNPGAIRTGAHSKMKVPAGRLGRPEDVAGAVVWLASDAAAYVNGSVIDVGGALWV